MLSGIIVETRAVLVESSTHLVDVAMKVAEARVKQLKPHVTVKPFYDQSAAHWLDDFDGDPEIDSEIAQFASETIFTLNPDALHKALDLCAKSVAHALSVHASFMLDVPATLVTAKEVVARGTTTKLGCQILGILSSFVDKPVKLKRALGNIYEATDDDIWTNLHGTVKSVVERHATTAALDKKNQTRVVAFEGFFRCLNIHI